MVSILNSIVYHHHHHHYNIYNSVVELAAILRQVVEDEQPLSTELMIPGKTFYIEGVCSERQKECVCVSLSV